jgi:hypothetical protein
MQRERDPDEQIVCPVCHHPITDIAPGPCDWCKLCICFPCAADLERGTCADCEAGDA